MMIHRAERLEANATSQMQAQCRRGESRFQPKAQTARKVDSRKKARVASMANSDPKISPTYREYRDQLVPN